MTTTRTNKTPGTFTTFDSAPLANYSPEDHDTSESRRARFRAQEAQDLSQVMHEDLVAACHPKVLIAQEAQAIVNRKANARREASRTKRDAPAPAPAGANPGASKHEG